MEEVLGAGDEHERERQRAGGGDRGLDPLDRLPEVVDRVGLVAARVLDRTAHGPGGGGQADRLGDVAGRGTEAVLQVGRDGERARAGDRPHVLDRLVARDLALRVLAGEREGEPGARRRQRRKAEALEDARRAGVPRIGDDERARRVVQRTEAGGALRLRRRDRAHSPSSASWRGSPRTSQATPRSWSSSQRLRAMPPAKPVSEPFAPITRWQGTTTATGFLLLARPTARASSFEPRAVASWP